MRILLLLIFHFILTFVWSQDTIYSVRYPNGIVTDSIKYKRKKYYIIPKESVSRMALIIPRKTLYKINYATGEVYHNKRQNPDDYFYLKTNALTGEVEYSNVLELNEIKFNLLTNLTDSLYSKEIEFKSQFRSEDSAVYQGRFKTQFAGDNHLTYFKLFFYNSDSNLIIRANNIKSSFIDSIKYNWDFMDTVKYKSFRKIFDITRIYSLSRRIEDKKTYWNPIKENLEQTLWKSKNIILQTETKAIVEHYQDSLVFKNFLYFEGLTGYANYLDKKNVNGSFYNRDIFSIGLRFGFQRNFGNNDKRSFGLGIDIGSFEMYLGDKGATFSISFAEIGPCFVKKINTKNYFEVHTRIGASNYFRMSSGYIGYEPSDIYWNMKTNLELKYRYQKLVFGVQGSYRYPQKMLGTSLIIGYSFN